MIRVFSHIYNRVLIESKQEIIKDVKHELFSHVWEQTYRQIFKINALNQISIQVHNLTWI
jgi:hypothetical protein